VNPGDLVQWFDDGAIGLVFDYRPNAFGNEDAFALVLFPDENKPRWRAVGKNMKKIIVDP